MNKNFNKTLKQVDEILQKNSGDFSHREKIFSRTLKLSEEVGEVAEAVLYKHDKSLSHKASKEIDLDEELADVLICTLLLARSQECEIFDIAHKKMQKFIQKSEE